jgi:WD40 repeat protein
MVSSMRAIVILIGLSLAGAQSRVWGQPPGPDQSREVENTVLSGIPGKTDYRARYAVIIGVGDYPNLDDNLHPLEFAPNDAMAFRDMLRDDFGFEKDDIRLLVDGDATREAIRDSFLKWLPAKHPGARDLIVFFFSGHGLRYVDPNTNERKTFLAPPAVRQNDLAGTAIDASWVRDQLARLDCLHKLIFLDCCYAGGLLDKVVPQRDTGGGLPSGGPGLHNLTDLLRKPAFWALTAGDYTPVAAGNTKGDRRSLFTSKLLEVMRERADTLRSDGAFTFNTLAALVQDRVANALESAQVPIWGRLGEGAGEVVFRPVRWRLTTREMGAYDGQIVAAAQAIDAGEKGPAEDILNGCAWPARAWEWSYLLHRSRSGAVGLTGHEGTVTGLAFQPGGSLLASSGGDGTVRLWAPSSVKPARTLQGPAKKFWGVAFSSDGKTVAAVGDNGEGESTGGVVALWEVATGLPITTLMGLPGSGRVVAFCPKAGPPRIAAAGSDGKGAGVIKVWDVAKSEVAYTLIMRNEVESLAFRPDGRRLVAADGELARVWDADDGKLLGVLSLGSGAAAFDAGRHRLAMCDGRNQIVSFDANDLNAPIGNKIVADVKIHVAPGLDEHSEKVRALAFNPKTGELASSGDDALVKVRDLKTDQIRFTLRGQQGNVRALAFREDGKVLATGSSDRTILLWDAVRGPDDPTVTFFGIYWEFVLSPDGRSVICGGKDGGLAILDLQAGNTVRMLQGHKANVVALAFHPDGRRFVSADEDGNVFVWDVQTTQIVNRLWWPGGPVRGLSFDRSGARLAGAGGNDKERGVVMVWEMDTGKPIRRFAGPTQAAWCVALRPDGTQVVAASGEKAVWQWDVESEKVVARVEGFGYNIAYSPDGRLVALADDSNRRGTRKGFDSAVLLLDADDLTTLSILQGHYLTIQALAFSPDSLRLASGGMDKVIKIWNVETSRDLLTLRGHKDWIQSLTFSADGSRLMSAGSNVITEVKVWDAPPDPQITTLAPYDRSIGFAGLDFSPDGRYLVVAGSRGQFVNGRLDFQSDVKVMDTLFGGEITPLFRTAINVQSVRFSPDGWKVAAACPGAISVVKNVMKTRPGEVQVWDAVHGETIMLPPGKTPAQCVAFHPKTGRLAAAGATIRLWNLDAAPPEMIGELTGPQDGFSHVAYSPDGQLIAAANYDKTVHVWPAEGGNPRILRGHQFPSACVAFAGHFLFSAAPDLSDFANLNRPGELKAWDLAAEAPAPLKLEGHAGAIFWIAPSPDGRRLISVGQDADGVSELKLWDTANRHLLTTTRLGTINALRGAYSRDGRYFATGAASGAVQIWDPKVLELRRISQDPWFLTVPSSPKAKPPARPAAPGR